MLHDVLIIGAGPSGLAAATALSRQLYTSVVFDSGLYRNARAKNMHNVLGFDHVPPPVFRAKARADIQERYSATVTFADVAVTKTTKLDNGLFKVEDAAGKAWFGRKLVLATGVTDITPDIEGYDDCWGHGIFHCLFCHGFEERGSASAGIIGVGMLANVKMATHVGYMARPLAKEIIIYTNENDALATEMSSLPASPFKVDTRKIARLRMGKKTNVIITFEDGTEVTEGFLAHAPYTEPNGPFVEQLGLEVAENGDIKTSQPFGETTVPGVYAVGDCGNLMKAVAPAATSGSMCAAGMVVPLQSEPKIDLDVEDVEKVLG
ncbi:Thioredoxin reductase gliT [Colletotrichum sp. SAR 10_96]|nr:Thioredoxin reductase gliT [Colletotrichum sp. SAR 10_96]